MTIDSDAVDVDGPPWERMPGEPARAYAAFRAFRDMPAATRSIDATADHPASGDTKPRQLRALAARWDWRARADAWDDECAAIEDRERLDQIRQMHSLHRRTGRQITVKAMQALALMEPEKIPPAAAVRLLELGTKLERSTLMTSVAELQGLDGPTGDDPWEQLARELDPRAVDVDGP